MLEYVNNPTQRRVIWVVGEKGNEGKTFIQDKIEEQYELHHVCSLYLTESSKNLLHYMQGCVDITTDIFLFNIPRCKYLSGDQYKILESIKDGKAMDGK